ncbi:O-antigen/teichoic acid export membrane protein [Pseudomonas putida]|jgi:O-antigen/teichoic acid export membrane protein|uniref:oligosaccharide flippase family protein n=1 Tax=Pseudomonas putida TaxID=303 RepID=UPI00104AF55B|nr:oligosaccharide flippase family protein [Pseudomonas putida]MCS4062620.1 O-antigen/teichoic acid export membrane protein [Pseudomonas putida]TCP75500.1 O-antigen/teichoic acid export membrane protein [Pseudomonas putida]
MSARFYSRLNTGFVRSVLLVAGGALVSQGLIVAVTPVLTRLFSPESFGVLAAFTSVLTILIALASLKYELAIPQAKSAKQAFEVAVLSFCVLGGLGLVATLLIVVAWLTPFVELPGYCWFIPPGLLFAGAFQIASYLAIRNKDFSGLTAANIQRSVVQSVLQVSAGLAALGSGALILGYVISQGAAGAKIVIKAFRGRSTPSRLRLVALAKKYKRFPVMAAPAALLNAAALNVSPFVIIYAFGMHEAGLFALAQRAMGVPMAFLGTAIANVYLAEIPRVVETSPDQVIVFYRKALRNLALLGLPIVLGAGLCLFYSVEFIFGSTWSEAAVLMLVLVPLFFGQFVVSPLSQTLNVIERQDVQLLWDFFRLCVPNLGFLMVALSGFSFVEALLSFSVLMFLMYVINVVVTLRILKRRLA